MGMWRPFVALALHIGAKANLDPDSSQIHSPEEPQDLQPFPCPDELGGEMYQFSEESLPESHDKSPVQNIFLLCGQSLCVIWVAI